MGYYDEDTEISQVTERQNLFENALHGLLNQQEQLSAQLSGLSQEKKKETRSEQYQNKFNISEKRAEAIVEAEDEGDHVKSMTLFSEAKKTQKNAKKAKKSKSFNLKSNTGSERLNEIIDKGLI